jgi:hypothetical protein
MRMHVPEVGNIRGSWPGIVHTSAWWQPWSNSLQRVWRAAHWTNLSHGRNRPYLSFIPTRLGPPVPPRNGNQLTRPRTAGLMPHVCTAGTRPISPTERVGELIDLIANPHEPIRTAGSQYSDILERSLLAGMPGVWDWLRNACACRDRLGKKRNGIQEKRKPGEKGKKKKRNPLPSVITDGLHLSSSIEKRVRY